MTLDRVPSGNDVPNDVNVIIEIPMHAPPIKYEVNKETGAMFVDRFMWTVMHYKDLEPGKWVKVIGWMDAEEAKAEIHSGIKRYKGAKTKPRF